MPDPARLDAGAGRRAPFLREAGGIDERGAGALARRGPAAVFWALAARDRQWLPAAARTKVRRRPADDACPGRVGRGIAFALLACALLAGSLSGESRALLVAVPAVPGYPSVAALEGPANDVASLRDELVHRWGFAAGGIRVLAGAGASRRAILDALDEMTRESRQGDKVVVYFSGHGISAHERLTGTAGYGMDIRTGALLPADVSPGTPEEILAQLIVGARDLRPRFERLDATGAETLVVIDACFSGDSAKSPPRLVPRTASLLPRDRVAVDAWSRDFERLLEQEGVEDSWPYERVVYLSASARDELAFDIDSQLARGERPTIDGKAHGVLTNGLLLALRGAADRNRDGQIAYAELHEYLVERVSANGQTPQLHPRRDKIVERPVLGVAAEFDRASPPSMRGALRLRVDPPDPALGALLAGDAGIEVTAAGAYDLEVRRSGEEYSLYLASGAEVGRSLSDRAALAKLLRQRARADRIAALTYPGQDMRFSIALEPEWGVYRRNDVVQVQMRVGQDSWLLLLSIDPDGQVYVVHPAEKRQARRSQAGEAVNVVALGVQAPFGTDRLEGFAFRDKPAGYDRWIGRERPLDEAELEQMVGMLGEGREEPGRARASRTVFTRALR